MRHTSFRFLSSLVLLLLVFLSVSMSKPKKVAIKFMANKEQAEFEKMTVTPEKRETQDFPAVLEFTPTKKIYKLTFTADAKKFYGSLLVVRTTLYTDSATVPIQLTKDIIEKVEEGNIQVITVNDESFIAEENKRIEAMNWPEKKYNEEIAKSNEKAKILVLTLGDRPPQ